MAQISMPLKKKDELQEIAKKMGYNIGPTSSGEFGAFLHDAGRMYPVIKDAPNPIGKDDSQIAQAYRNWYIQRAGMLPARFAFEQEEE